MDIQLNEEVARFLKSVELDFLAEYFTGDSSKMSLQQLCELSEQRLEEILEGPMYVARLRQELARLAPTHQQ
jgi:hypothetical protein